MDLYNKINKIRVERMKCDAYSIILDSSPDIFTPYKQVQLSQSPSNYASLIIVKKPHYQSINLMHEDEICGSLKNLVSNLLSLDFNSLSINKKQKIYSTATNDFLTLLNNNKNLQEKVKNVFLT